MEETVKFDVIGETSKLKVQRDGRMAEFNVKVVEKKYDGVDKIAGKVRCTVAMVNPSYVIRNRSKVQVQYQTSGVQDYQTIEAGST